jgi:hypothetical protein
MSTATSGRTTRRRFAFWVGLGLFTLGERLNAKGFDTLAAAAMRASESRGAREIPVHWTARENNTWRWFEREHLIDGHWRVTGITTPVHKETGKRHVAEGYLDESLVPEAMRKGEPTAELAEASDAPFEHDWGQPSAMRRARHGRPPSRWLRSLYADELRTWLKTIDVPEAGVEGMTFWEHLTRDHSFDPARIQGLDEADLAKLHAAAHYGY